MYYIKKKGKVVATANPDEVTKENFVVEPGGEKRVWVKLELYEYNKETGAKIALVNQVMGENPGDFELMAPIWKRQGMTLTMLHDPRGEMQKGGVAEKLAKLNAQLGEAPEEEPGDESETGAEEQRETLAEMKAALKALAEEKASMQAEIAALAKAKADLEAMKLSDIQPADLDAPAPEKAKADLEAMKPSDIQPAAPEPPAPEKAKSAAKSKNTSK